MEFKKTERGFPYFQFKDRYDHECSLQKSSLAFEDAVWFGVNDAAPQILDPEKGWKPFPVPEEVQMTTRMHLTQDQVVELLPILTRFAETGDI